MASQPLPNPSTSENTIAQFNNQAGAAVELHPITWTVRLYQCDGHHSGGHRECPYTEEERQGFTWRCLGCSATSHEDHLVNKGYRETRPRESRREANSHAASCHGVTAATSSITGQTAAAVEHIRNADQKANNLLTVFSIPLAVLIAAVPGHSLPPASTALLATGAAGLVAAMLIALYVLNPRLSGATRGGFLRLAQCHPDNIPQELAAAARGNDDHAELVKLCRIARHKYRALQVGYATTAISLLLLVAAALTANYS